MTGTTTAQMDIAARRSEVRPTLTAMAVAAVTGIVSCLIIATIAKAAGVPHAFGPLSTYPVLVVIGVVAGGLGWNIVRRRSADARRLLARLVPAVLILSFIPDVIVGVTKALPHTTWGGIAALMAMHLAVAAGAVASYRRFLPPRDASGQVSSAADRRADA
jgi:Family of unknown function (DUF6069)